MDTLKYPVSCLFQAGSAEGFSFSLIAPQEVLLGSALSGARMLAGDDSEPWKSAF